MTAIMIILESMKSYEALGKFQNWIIASDGTSRAVYEHGTLAFDAKGKIRRAEGTRELPITNRKTE